MRGEAVARAEGGEGVPSLQTTTSARGLQEATCIQEEMVMNK